MTRAPMTRGNPAARTHNGWDARTDKRIGRQETMIEALTAGKSVREAASIAGVTIGCYQQWRTKDPNFRAQAELAKSTGRSGDGHRQSYAFADFRRRFFHYETYLHQQRLVDALDSAKPGELVLCNIYPEAGKTATVEDWVCKTLALDPNRRITDVSESDGLAKKSCGKIKQRMTETRHFGPFIASFGPFYENGQERSGKPWATQYFTVCNSDHDERDYSFEARAVTSAALGSRIDDLILDDIQSRRSLSQTKTILEHIRGTYLTRGRHMRAVAIGNRLARGDVYEAFLDEGIVDNYISIPAIDTEGNVSGPEMWCPREDYETDEEWMIDVRIAVDRKRRKVGEEAWFAMYQQMPHANELSTFNDRMLDDAKDLMRVIKASEVGDYVALSLDPALGGGNALTAATHGMDTFTVLDQQISYGMSRTEDILANVEEFVLRYHPVLLIIERDAMQKHLIGDQRLSDMQARYGFQIVPHTTSRNKADPILGVASMAGGFLRKEIRLPYGDEFARDRMEPLITQLRSWRANIPTRMLTQDGVMSLWFNWRYWMENRAARAVDDDIFAAWQRQGTPYAATGMR